MSRLRVAIGPEDPAGIGSALAVGLRERGHRVEVVTWQPSPWGYRCDRVARPGLPAARFALSLARSYDVVHVMGGRSWLLYADLVLARAAKRTPLIQFNGCDCRTLDIAATMHPARARIIDPSRGREIRIHRRIAGRVARAALVQDLELADYLRDSFDTIYVAPFAIDLPAIERAAARSVAHNGDRPLRVLHAPTDRRIKGSAQIEKALATAARERGLETVVMSPSAHHEVLDAIAASDIVVDQLNAETPGVLPAEAMALGKPVLGEYDEGKLAPFARPCPVVAVTPETLTRELCSLATDPARRRALGKAGRAYARSVHSPAAAAAAAERVYLDVDRRPPPGIHVAWPDGIEPVNGIPPRPGARATVAANRSRPHRGPPHGLAPMNSS